jgi:hypothetical protein
MPSSVALLAVLTALVLASVASAFRQYHDLAAAVTVGTVGVSLLWLLIIPKYLLLTVRRTPAITRLLPFVLIDAGLLWYAESEPEYQLRFLGALIIAGIALPVLGFLALMLRASDH